MFLTECPRDAMQGWGEFIPTSQKIDYINALMDVGFDMLDCGSFVSPKAIPQMADTKEVISEINKKSNTKISVIVANLSGAEQALKQDKIDVLGFPFSISETFQYRNTNKNQEEAFEEVVKILEISKAENLFAQKSTSSHFQISP
jgi:hydroxymethylglutaryl-CoA lyase